MPFYQTGDVAICVMYEPKANTQLQVWWPPLSSYTLLVKQMNDESN